MNHRFSSALALVGLLVGCGGEDVDHRGLYAKSGAGELVYQGPHWIRGAEADDPTDRCAAGAPSAALQSDHFFDLEINVMLDCANGAREDWALVLGTHGLKREQDRVELGSVVHVDRLGQTFVTAADWAAYHGEAPTPPAFAGSLANGILELDTVLNGFSLTHEDERWQLFWDGVSVQGPCLSGTFSGTVEDLRLATGATSCKASGTVRFVPVPVRSQAGPVYLDVVAD